MTEKLSQFTDGGVPALTAYIAGANAGSPNLRYTLANIQQTVAGGFSPATINLQTVSYTLVLADAGAIIEMNSASPVTVTFPPNASVAFPIGTRIQVSQIGGGQVQIVGGAGVTLDFMLGSGLMTQFMTAWAYKRGTDEWLIAFEFSPLFAPGNLTFYVATTGSDSNPGTASQPFFSVQRAATIAGLFNYQGAFFPTINVGAGTFTAASSGNLLPVLVGLSGQGIVAGAGAASTTIAITGGASARLPVVTRGSGSNWTLQDVTVDASGGFFAVGAGINSVLNLSSTVNFIDSAAAGLVTYIVAGNFGKVTCDLSTLGFGPMSGPGGICGISDNIFAANGFIFITNTTVNISGTPFGTPNVTPFLNCNVGGIGQFQFFNNTVVNQGNFLGVQLDILSSQTLITLKTGFSDIPGTGINFDMEQSVFLNSQAALSTLSNCTINTLAPSTTNIVPGGWAFFSDDFAGTNIRLWANNNGTAVQLAGTGAVNVGSLPSPTFKGLRFVVNDATATTFASIVAGTGGSTVPVYSDGTNWRIG